MLAYDMSLFCTVLVRGVSHFVNLFLSEPGQVLMEDSYRCGRRWPGCHCRDSTDAIEEVVPLRDLDVGAVVAAMEQAEREEIGLMNAECETAS